VHILLRIVGFESYQFAQLFSFLDSRDFLSVDDIARSIFLNMASASAGFSGEKKRALFESYHACLFDFTRPQHLSEFFRSVADFRYHRAEAALKLRASNSSSSTSSNSSSDGVPDAVRAGYWNSISKPFQQFLNCERVYYSLQHLIPKFVRRKENLRAMYGVVPRDISKIITGYNSLAKERPDTTEVVVSVVDLLQDMCVVIEARMNMISFLLGLSQLEKPPNYHELADVILSLSSKFSTCFNHPVMVGIKDNIL
jgi:KICSTOR complex C12orf66 like